MTGSPAPPDVRELSVAEWRAEADRIVADFAAWTCAHACAGRAAAGRVRGLVA